jgi:NitT/TauT family transport system substrate-binding protein
MKKILVLVLGLAMAFCFAACGNGDETNGGTADNNNGDVLKVSVAAQPNSGQVFAYIAKDQGYLEEEGVDVEMVYINNGTDAYQALFADQVNVMSTYGTGSPLIQIAQGQDVTVFGGYMIIGETPCFGLPETEWTSLESFRGKKIGITRFGTPDVVLKGILYDAGIYPDDVTFVEYKKNQDTLQAVANGEVDFGATATGYQLQAAELGLEVKMWPDDYWPNHSCCRMLAKGEWMQDETNQEALVRMMRAFIRAEEYLQTHEQETIDLVVEELDLDRATVESFVTSEHMKYDVDPYKSSVIKMWDKMEDFGYITDTTVNIEEHINTSLYEKALTGLMEDYPDNEFFKEKWEEFETYNR